LTINNSNGIETSNYVLDFHFIEKQGIEDLPDGETTAPSTPEQPDPDQPDDDDETNADELNFEGVVNVLLSDYTGCLRDSKKGNAIPDAMKKLFGKRDPPYILHSSINSIPGQKLSDITDKVNENRTDQVDYILVGDPTWTDSNNVSQLILYMYYKSHCDNGKEGDEILVYRQVLTNGVDPSNGIKQWHGDGTYVGRAQIATLYSGGNSGNVKMIDPTTWKAGAPTTVSEP
jgi:hypothetical protein